jgi:hypothetical protein
VIMGKTHFHPECFVCAGCECQLQGAMGEQDGKYYCVECYKDLTCPKCASCSLAIDGKALVLGAVGVRRRVRTLENEHLSATRLHGLVLCLGCGAVIHFTSQLTHTAHAHTHTYNSLPLVHANLPRFRSGLLLPRFRSGLLLPRFRSGLLLPRFRSGVLLPRFSSPSASAGRDLSCLCVLYARVGCVPNAARCT